MRIEQWLKDNYGYDAESRNAWMSLVNMWRSWYRGYNKDFHLYHIWNGKSFIDMRRMSMQLAKKCCQDWADMLWNVSCRVTVSGENDQQNLNQLLSQLNFWLLVNQAVEKAYAVGTGALLASVAGLEYMQETGEVTISDSTKITAEYVDVDKIYPISWDEKSITECAFIAHRTVKGKKYGIVSMHLLEDGLYVIKNRAFKLTDSGEIDTDGEDEESILNTFEEFHTGSAKPWFCIISPAIANNVMQPGETGYDYPFKPSIFANSIDAMKCADKAYDAIDNELEIGRMRIFASESMMSDVNGQPVFDATDISVYVLPAGLNKDQLLQPVAPALRTQAMLEALTANLSVFSQSVGMGRQMYDFDVATMATAAQVYSTNSELKRSRDMHKTALENALFDFISTLCDMSSRFVGVPISSEGLTLVFDESMFEDVSAKSARSLQELDAGVSARWEYRVDNRGEDEETAKDAIAAIDAENDERMQKLQMMQVGEV